VKTAFKLTQLSVLEFDEAGVVVISPALLSNALTSKFPGVIAVGPRGEVNLNNTYIGVN